MSNQQQAYQRTLFDDSRYQLEGAVQSGAKWPAVLAVKPTVEEYKGYTNSFVRLVVRTNIDGDRNNGIIEAKIPVQTWYAIGEQIESLKGEDFKFEPIDCYERPFGRDKKPAKENTLMARIHIATREGRISIAVIDARLEGRVKIPFYFGTANTRCPLTAQGSNTDFTLNKTYALAWHRALSDLMPQAFKEMHEKALGRSTTTPKEQNGGDNQGSHSSGGASDIDDDLPF